MLIKNFLRISNKNKDKKPIEKFIYKNDNFKYKFYKFLG